MSNPEYVDGQAGRDAAATGGCEFHPLLALEMPLLRQNTRPTCDAAPDRFAVGDRVRCVKAFATVGNLEEGGEYTVAQSGAGYVRLAEDDFYLWRVDRFEPVEAQR